MCVAIFTKLLTATYAGQHESVAVKAIMKASMTAHNGNWDLALRMNIECRSTAIWYAGEELRVQI